VILQRTIWNPLDRIFHTAVPAAAGLQLPLSDPREVASRSRFSGLQMCARARGSKSRFLRLTSRKSHHEGA
jgi:hypothetical protein